MPALSKELQALLGARVEIGGTAKQFRVSWYGQYESKPIHLGVAELGRAKCGISGLKIGFETMENARSFGHVPCARCFPAKLEVS